MNDYNLMMGLGGPSMAPFAWLIYIVFIVLFVLGALYVWHNVINKDEE